MHFLDSIFPYVQYFICVLGFVYSQYFLPTLFPHDKLLSGENWLLVTALLCPTSSPHLPNVLLRLGFGIPYQNLYKGLTQKTPSEVNQFRSWEKGGEKGLFLISFHWEPWEKHQGSHTKDVESRAICLSVPIFPLLVAASSQVFGATSSLEDGERLLFLGHLWPRKWLKSYKFFKCCWSFRAVQCFLFWEKLL